MAVDLRLHPLEYTQRQLPFVCAETGEPAAWYARMGVRKPANPAALLLVFLGPIGWLILLVVLTRPDSTYLDVPISGRVHHALQQRRLRLRWLIGALALETIGFAYLAGAHLFPTAWLVFLPTLGLAMWVAAAGRQRIRLELDAAGLVTLRGAHPNFVAAVTTWRQDALRVSPDTR